MEMKNILEPISKIQVRVILNEVPPFGFRKERDSKSGKSGLCAGRFFAEFTLNEANMLSMTTVQFLRCVLVFLFVGTLNTYAQESLTQFVNPFIGTDGHGHTYPGATVPFGMVQVSPDNGRDGWDWSSGYHYSDSLIKGFSHTHFSGTGVGDLCDVLLMPAILTNPNLPYSSHFSHQQENAEPGYYQVTLSNGINVELTATARAGFHCYTFPQSNDSKIVIDLAHHINWDSPVTTQINIVNSTTVTGYRFSRGWAPNQKIFFVVKFSKPFKSFLQGNDSLLERNKKSVTGKGVKSVFDFTTKENEQILVKIGISAVDIEGAIKNLETEIPHWNLKKIRSAAKQLWEKELNKIRVTTNDRAAKETFYTALYHTMLAPVIYQDVDGRYRGGDDRIHVAKGFTNYTIFSLWDTFRAAHPLFTILHPERVNDFINSMLAFNREFGYLPIWNFHANETYCMIGYHSIPVIVDAYAKGFRGFDAEEAFTAMLKTAAKDTLGLNWYRRYNYVPTDLEVESVSKTLEYAFDDWCIAQMAKMLNRDKEFKHFSERAGYYQNLFDTSSLFFRGKTASGMWREPFDPYSIHHRMNDYTEGNAWQYSWFVPHDVEGLIRLNGGKKRFIERLDSLFEQTASLTGAHISPDVSGLIGQYAHGNEPSHHIAYLYSYAGASWKTQERVREIMTTMYNNTPAGLCGNEDCGQMSAWYILSALGMYPVNPAAGEYVIGSPLYESTEVRFGENILKITARNTSPANKYVHSVMLNGRALSGVSIRHEDLAKGGELIFKMSDVPEKKEGAPVPDAPR
ncbi:MAG: GH92 family glycosyl hydrolase [Bacteroidota bacterium]